MSPSLKRVTSSLHLGPDEVRVDEDAAHRPQLEEREQEVVVARIEREVRLGEDPAGLAGVGRRLLDCGDVRDLGELRQRLGLEVQHDALRDVVGDDRPVGGGRDRAEVSDDPATGGFV